MDGFSALLLAGGESSRFGSPKIDARLADGRWPFGELVARLRAAGERCALAGSEARAGAAARALALPRLDDARAESGPLAGLVAGLAAAAADDPLLLLPCDMPDWPVEARAAFARRLVPGVDAVLLQLDGRPNPVCALYRKTALAPLAAALAAGQLRIRAALGPLRVDYFDPAAAAVRGCEPGRFRSFNTPEELAALA